MLICYWSPASPLKEERKTRRRKKSFPPRNASLIHALQSPSLRGDLVNCGAGRSGQGHSAKPPAGWWLLQPLQSCFFKYHNPADITTWRIQHYTAPFPTEAILGGSWGPLHVPCSPPEADLSSFEDQRRPGVIPDVKIKEAHLFFQRT